MFTWKERCTCAVVDVRCGEQMAGYLFFFASAPFIGTKERGAYYFRKIVDTCNKWDLNSHSSTRESIAIDGDAVFSVLWIPLV